ncbi:MAG TPA: RDD family protein [Thermoanaerobaculaceae bacterium]|nr:RDD family protein [Thermoanaerobaculaceae bacterium]HRS15146.1 RDD family protein [Thermoanaerobaculaceae bacterium]
MQDGQPDPGVVLGLDNVALDLPIAGLGNRVLAAFIDQVILLALSVAVVMAGIAVAAAIGRERAAVIVMVAVVLGLFAINTGYFVLFEVGLEGQTPGKKVLGLRVVTENGGRPGVGSLVTRNVLRLVDIFIGVPMMALDARSRRLGDRLAGTLVVHTRQVQQELVLARLPAGWGARHAALVEALLVRAPGLQEARAEELCWRLLALAERDDPEFGAAIPRSGPSAWRLRRAFLGDRA